MPLRLFALTVAALILAGYGWGMWQHHTGWRDGQAALIAGQAIAAEKLRQENAHRQLVEDQKAVAADEQGAAKTITITKDVVRYVQRPNKTVCEFDAERVRLKTEAVANANQIAGFDK